MAEYFAQRSLVVYKIWVHKRRKPDDFLNLNTVRGVGIGRLVPSIVLRAFS